MSGRILRKIGPNSKTFNGRKVVFEGVSIAFRRCPKVELTAVFKLFRSSPVRAHETRFEKNIFLQLMF